MTNRSLLLHMYASIINTVIFMVALHMDMCKLPNSCVTASQLENNTSITKATFDRNWLTNIIPKRYRSYVPPMNISFESKTAPVFLLLTPLYVTKMSMKTMDFDVELNVLVEWDDDRLNILSEDELGHGDYILPQEITLQIWLPQIAFTNCKGDDCRLVSEVKSSDSGRVAIGHLWSPKAKQVNTIGLRVFYRKIFRFTCNFNFTLYPFDVQQCSIHILSRYRTSTPFHTLLDVVGQKEYISIPPGFRLLSFTFTSYNTTTHGEIHNHYFLTFKLQRVYSQHVMLVFLPSILIVTLSWLSFWLDVDNAAPRIALGLTTLLTLATQFGVAQKDLPPVAEIKAIDVWMFACMFIVFASLIEFGIANFYRKIIPLPVFKRRISQFQHYYFSENTKIHPNGKPQMKLARGCCFMLKPRKSTSLIDYAARILFPSCFLLFNLVFWGHFVLQQ